MKDTFLVRGRRRGNSEAAANSPVRSRKNVQMGFLILARWRGSIWQLGYGGDLVAIFR